MREDHKLEQRSTLLKIIGLLFFDGIPALQRFLERITFFFSTAIHKKPDNLHWVKIFRGIVFWEEKKAALVFQPAGNDV